MPEEIPSKPVLSYPAQRRARPADVRLPWWVVLPNLPAAAVLFLPVRRALAYAESTLLYHILEGYEAPPGAPVWLVQAVRIALVAAYLIPLANLVLQVGLAEGGDFYGVQFVLLAGACLAFGAFGVGAVALGVAAGPLLLIAPGAVIVLLLLLAGLRGAHRGPPPELVATLLMTGTTCAALALCASALVLDLVVSARVSNAMPPALWVTVLALPACFAQYIAILRAARRAKG